MEHMSGGDSFESSSDVLEAYMDEMVGVINLKDRVFEVATDVSLKEAFFKKIRLANLLPSIEVLLILSAESAMGEKKHAQFLKTTVESVNGEMNLSREENALSQFVQLTAAEAHEQGLIDDIVEDDRFQERCIEIAKTTSRVPASIVGMTKRLMQCDLATLENYFEMEAALAAKRRIKLPSDENR